MAKARVIESIDISGTWFTVGNRLNGHTIKDIIEEDGHVWIFDENDEIIVEIKNAPIILYYADAPEEVEESK